VFVDHNGVFLEKVFLTKGVSGSKVQIDEIGKEACIMTFTSLIKFSLN
jgi:hypothetical protein